MKRSSSRGMPIFRSSHCSRTSWHKFLGCWNTTTGTYSCTCLAPIAALTAYFQWMALRLQRRWWRIWFDGQRVTLLWWSLGWKQSCGVGWRLQLCGSGRRGWSSGGGGGSDGCCSNAIACLRWCWLRQRWRFGADQSLGSMV